MKTNGESLCRLTQATTLPSRRRFVRMPRGAKLYPYFVGVVGLAACALLAASLEPAVILTGCAVLAAGVLLRLMFRGLRAGGKNRTGV